MHTILAIDDGLVNGNLNFADLCFLVAFIIFVILFVISVMGKSLSAALTAAGFAFISLGLLVL